MLQIFFSIRVFHYIRDEICQETTLIQFECLNCADIYYYTLTQFGKVDMKGTMIWNKKENKIDCSCQMMDSTRISCRHIFYVMKVEQFVQISENMVYHQWTKKAKDYT